MSVFAGGRRFSALFARSTHNQLNVCGWVVFLCASVSLSHCLFAISMSGSHFGWLIFRFSIRMLRLNSNSGEEGFLYYILLTQYHNFHAQAFKWRAATDFILGTITSKWRAIRQT